MKIINIVFIVSLPARQGFHATNKNQLLNE